MKKYLLYSTICLLFSSGAFAGGYQLQEYSVSNLGRAFGGAGVVGDDYSAIAFNPAGMTYKNTGVQLGTNYVGIKAKATGSLNGGPSGIGKLHARKVLPHFFAQKRVNEKLVVGTGVYVPFGLGTYYKDGWFGSTHALNSEINVIDIAAAASYKLTDSFALGGSIYAERMDARLTSDFAGGTSDLNADDWSKGYSVSATFEPVKDTRFGATYRSKSIHKIKGPHYMNLTAGPILQGECGTKLVLPEHILLTAYQKMGKFGLSGMARWTKWRRFNKLTIVSNASTNGTGPKTNLPTVDEDWRNVWMVGTGLDYYWNENWTVRGGVAYDQGAVRRPANRTARVPDSDRWITALGASWHKNNWQVDVAYAHMFLKNAHSYNTNSGTTLDAKYRMSIDLLGLAVQYNF